MPHVSLHPIRARSVTTGVVNVSAKQSIKGMLLKVPHGFTEKASADEKEEIGHHHQEDAEGCDGVRKRVPLVDKEYVLVLLANW